MKTLIHFKSNYFLLIGLMFISLFILIAPSIWLADQLSDKSKDLNLFTGIGHLILMSGLILYAFYSTRLWFLCYSSHQKIIEKEKNDTFRQGLQTQLNADADSRIVFERERNQVNDLFRIAELSKTKIEKTTVRKEAEKPKETNTISETNKKEEINIQELNRLLELYQDLISKQQTKTT